MRVGSGSLHQDGSLFILVLNIYADWSVLPLESPPMIGLACFVVP